MSHGFSGCAAALMLLCGAAPVLAQADEFANRLVVMIKAGSSEGAGIICGVDGRGVYIATADHVARPGPDPAPVSVRFYNQPDREFRAEILNQKDADLDIAVIRVPNSVPFWRELQNLSWHHKADLSLLRRGSEVLLLGNPGGRPWRMSVRPETLAQIRGDLLEFESNLITGGHSGGALLTASLGIAGMLRSDKPPYGEAVSIDRILERFKRWGYPVNLSLPLPRITSGGEINCHLQPSGEARCWDPREDGPVREFEPVPGIRFLEISAGYHHICGIDTGGKTFCLGGNESGQLGTGNTSDTLQETPVPISGSFRFASISAGANHTCALDAEGRAYCWGGGSEGRLGNDAGKPSPSPVGVAGGLRFQSISAGSYHTCGVTVDGDLYCWGGILGSGKSRAGLDAPNAFVPLKVATNVRFRSVSAGREWSCALSVDGDGYCWASGEIANVDGSPLRTGLEIVPVPGRLKFKSISAGPADHACGVITSYGVYCWGGNEYGQLGDGTKTGSLMPVGVVSDLAFDSVSAGFGQTCAVSSGSTYCWGRNEGNGKPVRYAALGGNVPSTPIKPRDTNTAATVPAGKLLESYIRSAGGEAVKSKLPREWKGTLEFPLFGFREYCGIASVEYSGQPEGYTLQVKCRTTSGDALSVTLKSSGGTRTVTGQVAGRFVRSLSKDTLDKWGVALDREVSLFTEALCYPGFVAARAAAAAQTRGTVSGRETVVEFAHPSGRIDSVHFESGSGRLVYLSAVPAKGEQSHLEIFFDQYKQVDGVNAPFELRVNTKTALSVLKLREIQFRDP